MLRHRVSVRLVASLSSTIKSITTITTIVIIIAFGVTADARAALVDFSQDLAGFTAASGNSDVAVSFDDVPAGSDVGGQSFSGASLSTSGSPLIVVDAAATASSGGYSEPVSVTNRLFATSGANVLPPGGAALGPGPDAAIENDDLRIDFADPVGFFGFDHLSQRADGQSYTRVEVIDSQGQTILDSIVPISSLAADPETGAIPGAADFWGIVSDANDIAAIVFNEVDEDAGGPDNNVGYDSLRFGQLAVEPPPPPVAIPLPAAVLTAPVLAAVAALAARWRRAL
jgi:hypothetical protein